MSAGLRPEGFDVHMTDIHEASVEVLQLLSDKDHRLAIPALIMSLVSVAKGYAEVESDLDFRSLIVLIHEGVDALANDVIREEIKNGN